MKAQVKPRINLEGRTPLQEVIPLATPFIIFVDPASACNFSCSFCPTGHSDMIKDKNGQAVQRTWKVYPGPFGFGFAPPSL